MPSPEILGRLDSRQCGDDVVEHLKVKLLIAFCGCLSILTPSAPACLSFNFHLPLLAHLNSNTRPTPESSSPLLSTLKVRMNRRCEETAISAMNRRWNSKRKLRSCYCLTHVSSASVKLKSNNISREFPVHKPHKKKKENEIRNGKGGIFSATAHKFHCSCASCSPVFNFTDNVAIFRVVSCQLSLCPGHQCKSKLLTSFSHPASSNEIENSRTKVEL